MFEWLKRRNSPLQSSEKRIPAVTIQKESMVEATALPLKEKMRKKYGHLYVGQVIHYYPKIGVGIIRIEKGKLKTGDMVYIQGYVTKFKQKIGSIEYNHQKVSEVGSGYEVGIRLGARVRETDDVYVIT